MALVALVAMLAIAEYLYFTVQVGRARVRTGVKAPAVSGVDEFERYFRVQQNTIEQLVSVSGYVMHILRTRNQPGSGFELSVRRERHPKRLEVQGLIQLLYCLVVTNVHVYTPIGAGKRRTQVALDGSQNGATPTGGAHSCCLTAPL